MYNRYVPQPDGSHTRRPMPDRASPVRQERPPEQPQSPPRESRSSECPPVSAQPSSSFLSRLLPKDFDTGDLFVIFLLLLMAGDSPEERSNAILTLALYFLM